MLNEFVIKKGILEQWLEADLKFLKLEKSEEEMQKFYKRASKILNKAEEIESDIIGLRYHKDTDFYTIDMSVVDNWEEDHSKAIDFFELEDFT